MYCAISWNEVVWRICEFQVRLFICIEFFNFCNLAWVEKVFRPSVWASRTFSSVKVYGYGHVSLDIELLGIKRKHRAIEQEAEVFHEQFLV